jgi:Uma2 family endonuclease
MIPTEVPRDLLEISYYQAAQDYQRSLPPEHYMESTPHAAQREITLESLALVKARRSDVHVFNELLVQYPPMRGKRLGQVCPDNMVVIHPEPIDAEGSYDVPLQPARPFWMLEYVSKGTKRKDYVDNMRRYERDLKVPYYLLFDPRKQKLTLYRHNGKRYVAVKPNDEGRLAVPELDLEMAILDEWVRFWYKGEMLPLPAELLQALDETRRELATMTRRAAAATRRAETAERETEKLRKQVELLLAKKNGSA